MIHSLLDRLACLLVRLAAFFIQRVSLEAALRFGRGLGAFVYLFAWKRRRIAYVNLKAAFPENTVRERKRWVREMFCQLGMGGAETMHSPVLKKEDAERYVVNNKEPAYDLYVQKRRSGRGTILLTAHIGNWELSQIYEGLRGRPMTVLARRQKYRRLDVLLNSFREFHGSVSVGKEGGIRDLIRTLRKGGCVGMLADQSGGDDGVWVRFFGRLTTSPRGPIALGLKLGVTVLPVFSVRRQGPYHDLCFDHSFELVQTGDLEKDIQVNSQNYIQILESYLTRYPSQWLWGHKRWKRSRTKRILILSDGKVGHIKQSEALVKELVELGSEKEPPCEMPVERVEAIFKSRWHRRIFPVFALFLLPWVQGRLGWLRFFMKRESAERLERANADCVVSAGASLVPLNLWLTKENLAKSVILMKPGFPFNLFHYDLALVPAHDRGLMPGGCYRTHGSLSGIDNDLLKASRSVLRKSVRDPSRIRLSAFLGGETRSFKPTLSDVEVLLKELERASEKLGGDFLITTSRRTPEPISRFLQRKLAHHPRCQLCVIASEDKRPEVVPGMMDFADFLVVTEDSLSMISEALSSGKGVVVVKLASNGVSRKHSRFQEKLAREWGVPVVEARRLSEVFGNGPIQAVREQFGNEKAGIRERLESLL